MSCCLLEPDLVENDLIDVDLLAYDLNGTTLTTSVLKKIKMIHESYYWKKELYSCFSSIAKFIYLKRRPEQSFVKVEKSLMMGGYIIRKLNEAQKIPPNFLKKKSKIQLYKNTGSIVDYMNWHHIDRHYDLTKIHMEEKDWGFILNQLIHSYTLIYSFDSNDRPDGILINSDWTKKKSLYLLTFEEILTIFLTVSEGDITNARLKKELIGKDSKGNPMLGEMKLIDATYSYPNGLNISKEIKKTLKGNIYKRQK